MSPALFNIALGVADKVVVQIDEPSEKICPSSVWVHIFACQIQDGWKGKVDALRDKDDEGGDVSLGQGNATVAKGQVPETKHCVPQGWKTLMSKMENIDGGSNLSYSSSVLAPKYHLPVPQAP